jgi:hypothetical protein
VSYFKNRLAFYTTQEAKATKSFIPFSIELTETLLLAQQVK